MQIPALQEYGLRCLIQVALRQSERPVSVHEIARAEGLGPESVARIMGILRAGGLVESTRGAGGGYRLCRPAREISAWDAITVLGAQLFSESFCDCYAGRRRECAHATDCSLRSIWQKVRAVLRETLEAISLEDLQRDEGAMSSWLVEQIAARPN